nr:MAG: RNA-dependent RNA polymerase [Riboviria sp.]
MALPPEGWPVYGVNAQCAHNEALALNNRVMCPIDPPLPQDTNALWSTMTTWLPRLSLQKAEGSEVLALMNPASRKKYRRFMMMPSYSLMHWMSRTRLFTKMERIPIVKRGKPKAPRAIQTRSQHYHWLLAAYTKPLEHHLYNWRIQGLRVIAKGLNLNQRANLLRKHMRPGRVCISLDATDWDGHCSPPLLNLEHRYYLRTFQYDPSLQQLLRCQLTNQGTTLTGLSYLVQGSRMSGDMNTALGNCVLAASLALHAAERVHPKCIESGRVSVVCDGDDTLLFADEELLQPLLDELPRIYALFGHVLRVDGVAKSLQDIEFCQHKPMELSNGCWVMVPDPRKVLQTAFMATGRHAFSLPYYGTLWDCRARVHCGVPVYGPLFSRLARENPERLGTPTFFGFECADPGFRDLEITMDQRHQFAELFDFPLELQYLYENASVTFHPSIDMGDPAALG